MRSRADFRDETKRDARWPDLFSARTQSFDGLPHQFDLKDRIDVDRVNSGAHRLVNLVIRLARAVENDLLRPETNSERFEEFAAAVDLDVDPRVEHDFEDAHV